MKNLYKTVNINEIEYIIKNENDLIQKFLQDKRQWNNSILITIGQLIRKFNLKHFLNIGCHIGTVALPLCKYIDKVTAIEAYPPTFKHLEEHIKINNIKNIQVFNLAENSQNKKEINSLELTAALNFSKSWSGGFKVISDIEHKKNITNIFSIDYENDGLILGIAYMKSLEPDWISILENNSFKDYHRDRIRLFFELKGLGSIGRPKDNYLKRRSL